MSVVEFRDIPYSTKSISHRFDFYSPSALLGRPLVIFVHGGAWRSENKSDREHVHLGKTLAESLRMPVAIPNYRLSPPNLEAGVLHHPAHAEDILLFLEFLHSWQGPEGLQKAYGFNWTLIGHSCSAHMLASIFLDSKAITPSLEPSTQTLQAVQAIILSEGIYDLDVLLKSFPSYGPWFIENAFGKIASYAKFSTLTLGLRSPRIHWLVLHSKKDSLVDEQQSILAFNRLSQISPGLVTINTNDLNVDHKKVTVSEVYFRIVCDFIETNTKSHTN